MGNVSDKILSEYNTALTGKSMPGRSEALNENTAEFSDLNLRVMDHLLNDKPAEIFLTPEIMRKTLELMEANTVNRFGIVLDKESGKYQLKDLKGAMHPIEYYNGPKQPGNNDELISKFIEMTYRLNDWGGMMSKDIVKAFIRQALVKNNNLEFSDGQLKYPSNMRSKIATLKEQLAKAPVKNIGFKAEPYFTPKDRYRAQGGILGNSSWSADMLNMFNKGIAMKNADKFISSISVTGGNEDMANPSLIIAVLVIGVILLLVAGLGIKLDIWQVMVRILLISSVGYLLYKHADKLKV